MEELRKFMKNFSLNRQSVRNRHRPNKRQKLCCLNQISASKPLQNLYGIYLMLYVQS